MQKHQNIYDNEEFFEGYKSLRGNTDNYNVLLEQPAMRGLLPDLNDKDVLDLGCGYGTNSMDFINRNARSVVGVDISERMLEMARTENSHDRITYKNMSMTDIDTLDCTFDFVYSSLAFHYIENFDSLCRKIYSVMNSGGTLLFSQEHPIVTAAVSDTLGNNKDENGNYVSYTIANYNQPGIRLSHWFVDNVEKYHRRFSDIINALINAGFVISKVHEAFPSEEARVKKPALYAKELNKPTFLFIKAEKP